MHEVPVKSRIIDAIYFDPADGQLRLLFKNGEDRLFTGVPQYDVQAMVDASSPGQYYIDHIRTRFRRLAA
jgi:hypothetical protein